MRVNKSTLYVVAGAIISVTLISAIAVVSNCFQHYYTPADTGEEDWHSVPKSNGSPITDQNHKDHLQVALDQIAAWEAACPSLPTISRSNGVLVESIKVSQALAEVEVCFEDNASAKKDVAATSNPGNGVRTLPSGAVHTVSGNPKGVNINKETFEGDMNDPVFGAMFTAGDLLHEAFHLFDIDSVTEGTICEREAASYQFEAEWFCELAGCVAADSPDQMFACGRVTEANKYLAKHDCGGLIDCGNCSNGQVQAPQASTFSRNSFRARFITGPNSTSPGYISVVPDTNELTFSVFVAGGNPTQTVNMGVEIPGFQITCLDLPKQTNLGTIAIGGYDINTGEGMLVRGVIDFSQLPFIAFAVEYKGSDFGAPFDIYAHPNKPNRVMVLDSTFGTLLSCNIVSDQCTILTSVAEHPELADTRQLAIFETTGTGADSYLLYVATSGDAASLTTAIDTQSYDTEVHLFDRGADLVIDEIRVR